jgi:hypothetical protein
MHHFRAYTACCVAAIGCTFDLPQAPEMRGRASTKIDLIGFDKNVMPRCSRAKSKSTT